MRESRVALIWMHWYLFFTTLNLRIHFRLQINLRTVKQGWRQRRWERHLKMNFALIPSCSGCKSCGNYPGIKLVKTSRKVCVNSLRSRAAHKISVIISLRSQDENGKKMYWKEDARAGRIARAFYNDKAHVCRDLTSLVMTNACQKSKLSVLTLEGVFEPLLTFSLCASLFLVKVPLGKIQTGMSQFDQLKVNHIVRRFLSPHENSFPSSFLVLKTLCAPSPCSVRDGAVSTDVLTFRLE